MDRPIDQVILDAGALGAIKNKWLTAWFLQMSLKLKNSGNYVQQNISTDSNANAVIIHVVENGLDVTIHDDFDKVLYLFYVLYLIMSMYRSV